MIAGKLFGHLTMRSLFSKTWRLVGLLGILAVFFTGCANWFKPATPPVITTAPPPHPQALQIGDRVSIAYFIPGTTPTMPDEELVSQDGKINVRHLVDPVKVAGLLSNQVEEMIRTNLVPNFYRSLTVTVTPLYQTYFVGGEVMKSGQLTYNGRITLTGAIQAAGGFNDFADRHVIQITRSNGTIENVDFEDARANPAKDLQIFPHDSVFVRKRF